MSFTWYTKWRINTITSNKPLILKIETTNICNARCCFCAYERSKRPRTVLNMDLFDKALNGYCELGGGPVTLTPVTGDVLLDPYLMQRFDRLKSFSGITDVSFTTNLIAHDKLSDTDWSHILRRLRYLQISIGGYDSKSYFNMFGVNSFDKVWAGLHRISAIKKQSGSGTRLAITLRVPDVKALLESKITVMLKDLGYDQISGISSFGNWCGDVDSCNVTMPIQINAPVEKGDCCCMPALFMAILSNGLVTGCSCVDHNGDLEIGSLYNDSLSKIWHGMQRMDLCQSFTKVKLYKLCVDCSSYTSIRTMLTEKYLEGLSLKHLPTKFYDQFGGG